MERLTKRLPGGAANYNYPKSCYIGDRSGADRISQSAFRQRCVEQLADYEDTKLTPEEIDMDHEAAETLRQLCRNCDLDRVEKLAEADKDGRVVHGRWIRPHWKNNNYCCDCSECGGEAMHRDYQWDKNGVYPICPNCGAKMDGGADHEDD